MVTPSTAKWPRPRSEDEFEDIALDALRLWWGDPTARRHGRRGQRQNGVDIWGTPPRLNAVAGAQCKNVDRLAIASVVAEIAKAETFVPPLSEYVFAIGGPRDASLEDEVRVVSEQRRLTGLFRVQLLFWEDLCHELAKSPELVAKHFQGWPGSPDEVSGLHARIRRLNDELLSLAPVRNELAEKLQVLLDEAEAHFRAGHVQGQREQYGRALSSWDDALRLVHGHGGAPQLEGKILAVVAGVQAMTGLLDAAIANGRRARLLLDPKLNAADYWWALGNLAFALSQHQEFDEAASLFRDAIAFYDAQRDWPEYARSVQLLIELEVQRRSLDACRANVVRLLTVYPLVLEMTGPSELTLGFLGTIGNAQQATASELKGEAAKKLRQAALVTYERLEQAATEANLVRLRIQARAQRGYCLWHLDRLHEAEQLLRSVVDEDCGEFGKTIADTQFNRALILGELGRTHDAIALLEDACSRYVVLGDHASLKDAERQLERLAV